MVEENFAALRPRRSNILTPENSLSTSPSNFRQYNQRDQREGGREGVFRSNDITASRSKCSKSAAKTHL